MILVKTVSIGNYNVIFLYIVIPVANFVFQFRYFKAGRCVSKASCNVLCLLFVF